MADALALKLKVVKPNWAVRGQLFYTIVAFLFSIQPALGQDFSNAKRYGPAFVFDDIPNVLFFVGEIRDYDYFEVRRAVRREGIETIVLSSPGGSVWEGLMIAGLINDLSITTYIPDNGLCASACSYIFFAGATRIVDGQLGVHQFYPASEAPSSDHRATQFTVSEIVGFLNEFGTPPFVYELMFQQEEMYFFSEDEVPDLERRDGAQLSLQAMQLLDRRLQEIYSYLDSSNPGTASQPRVEAPPPQEEPPSTQEPPSNPTEPTPEIQPAEFRSASQCLWTINQIQQREKIEFAPGQMYSFADGFDVSTLRLIADVLQQCTRWVFEIGVHAFEADTPANNLILSSLRASYLRSRLQALGVPRHNMINRGYGDSQPLVRVDTPEDIALNTRVTFGYAGTVDAAELEDGDSPTRQLETYRFSVRPIPRPRSYSYVVVGLSQNQLTLIRLVVARRTGSVWPLEFSEVTNPYYFRWYEAEYLQNRYPIENNSGMVSTLQLNEILSIEYTPPRYPEVGIWRGIQNSQRFEHWEVSNSYAFCGMRTVAVSTSSNLLQFIPEIRLIHMRGWRDGRLDFHIFFPQAFALEERVSVSIDGRQVPMGVYSGALLPLRRESGSSTDLTRSMRAGAQMSISGINRLTREPLTVEFSLLGFTEAFYQMMADCDAPELEAWFR